MGRFGAELELSDRHLWNRDSLYSAVKTVAKKMDFKQSVVQDHENKMQWNVKGDSSCGHELTTPALSTQQAEKFGRFVGELTSHIHEHEKIGKRSLISSECGFHVHHDMQGWTCKQKDNLVRVFWQFEPALYSLVSRGRRNSDYVYPARLSFNDDGKINWRNHSWQYQEKFLSANNIKYVQERYYSSIRLNQDPENVKSFNALCINSDHVRELNQFHDHYTALNFTRHNTCEIRYSQSRINPKDVECWILLLSMLVDTAKKSSDYRINDFKVMKRADLVMFLQAAKTTIWLKRQSDQVCQWIMKGMEKKS